jgi:hypothetical protein
MNKILLQNDEKQWNTTYISVDIKRNVIISKVHVHHVLPSVFYLKKTNIIGFQNPFHVILHPKLPTKIVTTSIL